MGKVWYLLIGGGAAVLASCSWEGNNSSFSSVQHAELEALMEQYIVQHPQVLKKSLEALISQEIAEKEQKKAKRDRENIQKKKREIFQNSGAIFLGNEKAMYTWALFVDPYCFYCSKLLKELEQLIQNFPQINVLVRAISFNPESEKAVLALMAAQVQGKGLAFLRQLEKAQKVLSGQKLHSIARDIGLKMTQFQRNIKESQVKKWAQQNMKLAEELNIEGTPSLIWGDQIVEGYMSLEKLSLEAQRFITPNSKDLKNTSKEEAENTDIKIKDDKREN